MMKTINTIIGALEKQRGVLWGNVSWEVNVDAKIMIDDFENDRDVRDNRQTHGMEMIKMKIIPSEGGKSAYVYLD